MKKKLYKIIVSAILFIKLADTIRKHGEEKKDENNEINS